MRGAGNCFPTRQNLQGNDHKDNSYRIEKNRLYSRNGTCFHPFKLATGAQERKR